MLVEKVNEHDVNQWFHRHLQSLKSNFGEVIRQSFDYFQLQKIRKFIESFNEEPEHWKSIRI
jgi:hypothetical protein